MIQLKMSHDYNLGGITNVTSSFVGWSFFYFLSERRTNNVQKV